MLGLMSILSVSLILGILILGSNSTNNKKKTYLIIIFSIMFFYSAFRGENVGIDTYNYKMRFYEIQNQGLWHSFLYLNMENGYILLNYLLGLFFHNAQIIFIVTSFFIAYAFGNCIYKYSDNVVLSTYIYIMFFFSSTMNISRQYIAFGFIMFSFQYLISKKSSKAILLLIIAISFHNTAIIFFPFIILTMPKFKIDIKVILLFCVISIIGLYMFDSILKMFLHIFPIYERFMYSSKYSAKSKLSMFWLVYYIVILIIALIAMKKANKTRKFNKKDKVETIISIKTINHSEDSLGLFIILYVAFIVCYIFSQRIWIASRILAYFKPSLCILLPNTLERVLPKKSFIKYIIYLIFVGISCIWAYSMFFQDPHGLLPYKFFWN